MNPNSKELAVEMIELGVATVETKGHIGVLGDENGLQAGTTGLTDD
jgi:hypothetical protein